MRRREEDRRNQDRTPDRFKDKPVEMKKSDPVNPRKRKDTSAKGEPDKGEVRRRTLQYASQLRMKKKKKEEKPSGASQPAPGMATWSAEQASAELRRRIEKSPGEAGEPSAGDGSSGSAPE